MKQEAFNEIVERFRCHHPESEFVKQAEWNLSEGDDSDSVKIEVRLMVKLESNGRVYKIPFLVKVQTQDVQESIECAILAINDDLLFKLQTIENLIL